MIELNVNTPISWFLVLSCVVISLLLEFNQIDQFHLYFHLDRILHGEVWRLFSSLLVYGNLSFNTILSIWMLVRDAASTEANRFSAKPIDFMVFVLFGMICLWIWALFTSETVMGHGLSGYFLYYLAKIEPDQHMIVGFLPIGIRRAFIPYVLLATSLGSGRLKITIVGYVAAQIYFFLKDVINLRFKKRFLCAPDWMNKKLYDLLQ